MDQETQENKTLNQQSEQMMSLNRIAQTIFSETRSVYQYEQKEKISESASCLLELGGQSIRIFGRVSSKQEMEKQNQFFNEQTCLMMIHTVLHVQRLIQQKAFDDQTILQFIKTIAFKQLEKDQWQLQYLKDFQKILDQDVDVNIHQLSKQTFETFIILWIKAREFSEEINQSVQNSIIKNNVVNSKTGWSQIQYAIYEKSKGQYESKIGKQIQDNFENTKQEKFITPSQKPTIYEKSKGQYESTIGKQIQDDFENTKQEKFITPSQKPTIYEKSKGQYESTIGKQIQDDFENTKQEKFITPREKPTKTNTNELKITKMKQEYQIYLIPNGKMQKIIQFRFFGIFSKQNHLPLSKETKFREINTQLLIQTSQLVQIQYQGQLNFNLKPHGQGELLTKLQSLTKCYKGGFKDGCLHGDGAEYVQGNLKYYGKYSNNYKNGEGCVAIQDNKYIKGIFQCDRSDGIFEAVQKNKGQYLDTQDQKYYFQLNRLLDKNSPQDNVVIQKLIKQQKTNLISENPSYVILQIGQISLNNFQISTLNPGQWFSSSIIDAFIHLQNNFELLKRNHKIDNPYLIVNIANCQDIFSSVITCLNALNFKEFEKIHRIQLEKMQCEQFQRILFIFNYDRSHFLIFVYEQEILYQIDSLDCDRSVLYNLICKLLTKFNYKVSKYWRLSVLQQNNYYDCGPYACFYAMQLLRMQHLIRGEQFQFLKVDQEQISRFRLHVSRVLHQSSANIYPI